MKVGDKVLNVRGNVQADGRECTAAASPNPNFSSDAQESANEVIASHSGTLSRYLKTAMPVGTKLYTAPVIQQEPSCNKCGGSTCPVAGEDTVFCDNCDHIQQVAPYVPESVLRAAERMSMPLEVSRLSGVTAEEDARCTRLIADFIRSLAAAPSAPSPPRM